MNHWICGTEVGKRYRTACVKKLGETEGEDKHMVGSDAGKETETENWSQVQTWYYLCPDI